LIGHAVLAAVASTSLQGLTTRRSIVEWRPLQYGHGVPVRVGGPEIVL